ncbi:MAG: methylated-DNA--[protein]-cysteine S-methyltransferase [Opitutaceae bacterium]|nr:methylated-DNA--[protein]-cysteine S-methyltransferase [Opitutaceae bacterium]
MTCYTDTFDTQLGPFSVAVDDTGAVIATAFGPRRALRGRLPRCHLTGDIVRTAAVRRQIEAYLVGQRQTFELKLAPAGTPFQQQVWRALRKIPRGRTTTYGELAAKLKRPGAARAVGRANATNPLCVIVPCHRVIGAGGALTGYAFGVARKQKLLALEAASAVA